MLSQDLVATARLRYLGTSAQKTRLVVDLIRGRSVGEALASLRFANKAVARDLGRVLESAVANARQKKQDIDVDRLYVHTAFVDGGPSLKRVRPAPMGRAFRVQKRMCHITLGLGETRTFEPPVRKAVTVEGTAPAPERPHRKAAGPARRRKAGARTKTGAKKKRSAKGKKTRARS